MIDLDGQSLDPEEKSIMVKGSPGGWFGLVLT